MTGNRTLRVATRGSRLALAQTEMVVRELQRHYPAMRFETIVIRTTGDAVIDRSLDRVGGKGLFTEELERAILTREVDFAVHSLKDLPTELPGALALGAIPAREDAHDALIGIGAAELANPTRSVRIGTCSLRRVAQLRRRFPKVQIVMFRGNVDTRIRKVQEGEAEGAVLALAGLRRLGRADVVSHVFTDDEILPAPGQGALAVEIRADDRELRELLSVIHCAETEFCVTAEREFLRQLGGGCQVPVGAHAVIENGTLTLRGNVISPDGEQLLAGTVRGTPTEGLRMAETLAKDLLSQGADGIIGPLKRDEERGQHE